MDFWSRLLAKTPLSEPSRKDAAKDPIRRLRRFEKEYSLLLQIWRNSANLARDPEAAENIELRLQGLTSILADETRRPLPHPCIAFSAAQQLYVPITKIATISYSEWIIKEAVLFFATLVESEEEAFVESHAFAASLTNLLVKITGTDSIRLEPDTEVKVVELAFNITTKIRLDPGILPAWFKAQQHPSGGGAARAEDDGRHDSHGKFEGRTQRQDFPLFYLLMDYIHHEGKMGDFARTGLLYIIEAASGSVALEQWIVESDLSTLMATGLGALYSQLSRKLVIDYPPQGLPPILAFSDYEHPRSNYEIVSSCSPELQAHLETFLSHLIFWQDVLNHCKSLEVKQTLLEHFQVIFLQQLLYPSLLESSDIDGGSSVAVLTYLRRILESLDHPDMINLILHYLLALPDIMASADSTSRSSVSLARKRKSMDLATMMAAQVETTADPLLFNLVDLILACLRSQSHQTIHVTLQLVSAILKRHHRYAVLTLLQTESIHGDAMHRTIGAHQQEVDYFMSLASVIGGQDNFDEVYESVLKDTTTRLESHPCSLKLMIPKISINNHQLPDVPDTLPGAPRDVRTHTLRPDDPLLNNILDLLETFFLNPVETNLSITETLFDLAMCGYMVIEGWLLRSPDRYLYDDEPASPNEPSGDPATVAPAPDSPSYPTFQTLQAMKKYRQRPKWTSQSLPRLLRILQTLADQVNMYRETIPRFDELMQQRREAFQTADSSTATPMPVRAKNPAPSTPGRSSMDESRSGSPARPSALEGFAQRILSEFGTPSRSASPHGRKEVLRGTPGAGPSLSGSYGFATPTSSKPMPSLPKEFPVSYEVPSRNGVARPYSPGSQRGDTASIDGRDPAVVGQLAAYHAIDQQILARRVGAPSRKQFDAIPLSYNMEESDPTEEDAGVAEDGDLPEADIAPSEEEGTEEMEATPPEQEKTVTVSHVVTNAIVLQSFLFELASLVQVRAGLFDNEVRFA